eukprot:1152516-Pelagomonas_calceolata.AAC.3
MMLQGHTCIQNKDSERQTPTGYYSYCHILLPTVQKKFSNVIWNMLALPSKLKQLSTSTQVPSSIKSTQYALDSHRPTMSPLWEARQCPSLFQGCTVPRPFRYPPFLI